MNYTVLWIQIKFSSYSVVLKCKDFEISVTCWTASTICAWSTVRKNRQENRRYLNCPCRQMPWSNQIYTMNQKKRWIKKTWTNLIITVSWSMVFTVPDLHTRSRLCSLNSYVSENFVKISIFSYFCFSSPVIILSQ